MGLTVLGVVISIRRGLSAPHLRLKLMSPPPAEHEVFYFGGARRLLCATVDYFGSERSKWPAAGGPVLAAAASSGSDVPRTLMDGLAFCQLPGARREPLL